VRVLGRGPGGGGRGHLLDLLSTPLSALHILIDIYWTHTPPLPAGAKVLQEIGHQLIEGEGSNSLMTPISTCYQRDICSRI